MKCSCRCRRETKASVYQREFDNPINPLFADALSAGRIIAARGVLAQGGEVNGVHEGKVCACTTLHNTCRCSMLVWL